MADKEIKEQNNLQLSKQSGNITETDIASRFLSEALRQSFLILNIIMILLVVIFLASGFTTIEPDEQALILQFGKISERGILGPGLQWVFPYPINEIVRIPTEKRINIPINSFWYRETSSDLLPQPPKGGTRVLPTLNPTVDGYCITRGEQTSIQDLPGMDYNIVHSKWQLTYKIDDPERYFRNAYVETVKPGQVYFTVIKESLDPFLRILFEDAVVDAMVNYSIDEALQSQERIPKHVEKLLQRKLDLIESGILVESVQLTNIIWPRQVNEAFWDSIRAKQTSETEVSEAKGYAAKTLNETAGEVAMELFEAIKNDDVNSQEPLWQRLAGQAQEEIAQARAYRTNVVETAKANAEYLQKILPEYRKNPKLVLQRIYQDAIEYVLDNVDEKMIIQPTSGAGKKEIRILLNRDPAIKPKPKEEQKGEK